MGKVYRTFKDARYDQIVDDVAISWTQIKEKIIKICECSQNIMISIVDVKQDVFLSSSYSFFSSLGYDSDTIITGGWKFWFDLIDPREVGIVKKRVFSFMRSPGTDKNAIFLKYHMKSAQGEWRYIKHELIMFSFENKKIAINYIVDFSEKEHIERYFGKTKNTLHINNTSVTEVSSRECEVLKLIANGFSSKQIADKLFISDHTAISHRKNLLEKFNANNTAQLIKKASELMSL